MTKKIFIILILALAGMTCASAQMRIGGSEAPNKSAVLDLNPDNDTISGNATLGLALPRINLKNSNDAFPLKSHVKGMIVYNTATTGDLIPGVYINDGKKWLQLVDSNTQFSDSILQYISNNTLNTALVDSIITLIHENGLDGYIGNFVTDATPNGGLVRSGTGDEVSPYTLGIAAGGVTTERIADKSVTFNKLADNTVVKLGDNLAQKIYNTVLGDSIISYITENFNSTQLGDSITYYLIKNFEKLQFGESVMQYINNNLDNSALMDNIASLINNNNSYLTELIDNIAQNVFHTTIGDSIVSYISKHINDTLLGDSIVKYIAENIQNTVLGNNIINLVHANELDGVVGNEVTDATPNGGLVRSGAGTEVSPYTLGIAAGGVTTDNIADKSLTFNKLADNTVVKLGDNLAQNVFHTTLGDSIVNYISNHITDTLLGDSMLQYIAENIHNTVLGDNIINLVHENELDGVVGNEVTNATPNEGLVRSGAGTEVSPYTLGIAAGGVTTDMIADKSLTFNKLAENTVIKLGDNLAQNIYNTVLGDSIINYITQNFNSTQLGDSISYYLTKNFENLALGDTVMQYINNNLDDSALMDNIASLINHNNSYLTELIDNIAQNVFHTTLGGSIINYVSNYITDTLLSDSILKYIAENIHDTVLGDNIINLVHENELDGVVGNEVTDATLNGGLVRSGAGTEVSPYTLGIVTNGVKTSNIADSNVTTTKIADNAITSAKILDGTIINADISSSAAIDLAKIALPSATANSGKVLKSNGTAWIADTDNDSNTTYSAGSGLTLTGTTFSVGTGQITNSMIADNAVTSAKIAAGAITNTNISGSAAIDLSKIALPSASVNNGKVLKSNGTAWIADTDINTTYSAGAGLTLTGTAFSVGAGQITGSMIADNAITSAKIAAGAITNTNISNSAAIDLTKIALPTAASNNGKALKSNGTAWIADTDINTTYSAGAGLTLTGTVFSVGAGQITGSMIADNAITSTKIAAGAITNTNISNSAAIDLTKIALPAASSNSGKVLKSNGTAWIAGDDNNTDTNTTYTAGSGLTLTGTAFSVGTGQITGGMIADNAITSTKIAAGTITNANISSSAAIDLSKIALPSAATNSGKVLKSNGSTWVADTDNDSNTTYSAGSGLTLSGNAFSVGTGQITSAMIADGTIASADLSQMGASNGQVLKWTGTAWAPSVDLGLTTEVDGIVGNEVTDATASGGLVRSGAGTAASPYTLGISPIGVTTARIADKAVTSAKIADATITNANISATAAIDLTKIALPAASSNNGKVLKSNGTAWIADTDNNTTYSAGSGLSLSGTTFSIGSGSISANNLSQDAIPVVTKTSYPMSTGTVNATGWFDATTLNAMNVPGGIYLIRVRMNMSASSITTIYVQINVSNIKVINNPVSSPSRQFEFIYINDTPSTSNQTITFSFQTATGSVTISSGTIDLYRIARL